MKSRDVIRLYDIVGEGARVSIVDQPLARYLPEERPAVAASSDASATGAANSQ